MGDEIEFEQEEYGDAQEGIANSAIQARINELMKTPTCGLSECTAKQVDPAEEAWLKLMSAVPKIGQTANITPARDIQSYALPNGESVQSLVQSLRPSPADEYSIERISSEWKSVYTTFMPVPEDLKTGLSTLSEDWEGDDYDAFEEEVEKVIKNCRTILADIWGEEGTVGGAVKILDEKSDDIFSQQGGNECVYPSPKFHLEDAAACSHKIHIRPPYFPECEVFPDDETKVAMEWAGFEPTIVDEVQEERERIYNLYNDYTREHPDYEEDGLKGEELARTRADEYAKRATDDLGTDGQEQLQAQASQVNEDITDRSSNTNMSVSEITPEASANDPTGFNENGAGTEPPGGLDGGVPTGVGGSAPSLGDMSPPGGSPSGLTPSSPGGLDTGGLDTGGLDTGGLDNGGLDNGGLDDNPWESSVPDPDDVTGGLASGPGFGGGGGGGGGLPGGGLPGGGGPGGGIGGGAGGGLGGGMGGAMGGMMGGAGGARGAGAGAGGRGGGGPKGMGRGMGAGGGRGAMGGMMGAGGGRGAMGQGENQGESGTWLTEDDDVWGIGNEEEDPYA